MNDAITKSSTGMDGNVAGALCYAFGWVTGVIFLLIEKESTFVRFHALQSIITFLIISALYWIVGFIPYVRWVLYPIIGILGFVLWILLMYKAYKGEMFKLPIAGEIAAKQADR
jgi:uncharacterized membrane protein